MTPLDPGRRGLRLAVLAASGAAVAIGLALAPRIPQDAAYHRFADDRAVFGVPNAWNVLSNLPFLVVGALGLGFVLSARSSRAYASPRDRVAWAGFFLGVAATAFGSGAYHLDPTTESLFWDRLPMAVAFASLTAALVGERIGPRAASVLAAPLVAAGVGSVLAWRASEAVGAGDLRAYAAVQFGPVVWIPLAIALFPARGAHAVHLGLAFGAYALAKVVEALDHPIYDVGRVVSGHTLKHLAAAAGAALVLRMLRARARDADEAGRPEGRPA